MVNASDIVKDPHIVGHHDSQIIPIGKGRPQILAVPLDRHGDSGGIKSVGTVANPSSPAASAEGQHLPEGVKEQRKVRLFQVLIEDLRVGVRNLAREPLAQPRSGPSPQFPVFLFQKFANPVLLHIGQKMKSRGPDKNRKMSDRKMAPIFIFLSAIFLFSMACDLWRMSSLILKKMSVHESTLKSQWREIAAPKIHPNQTTV
jgi:hypothetical protein